MKKVLLLVLACTAYFTMFSQNLFPPAGNVLINTSSDNGSQLQVNGSATVTNDVGINGLTFGRGSGGVIYNTASGYRALGINTTGTHNTAAGYNALGSNTTGASNVAFGKDALAANTTATRNTAIGVYALESNTTGNYNTAVGYDALGLNTTGIHNNVLGHFALYANRTGNGNIGMGQGALYYSTGSYNIGLGYLSGFNQSAGNNNIIIGSSIDLPNRTGSNQMNIGNVIYGVGTNTSTIGAGNIGIGTTTPRSKLETVGTGMFSSAANGSSFIVDATNLQTDNNNSNVRLVAGSGEGKGYLKTSLENFGGYFSWARGSSAGQEVEVMRIDATSGNVGIGTASPSEMLSVNGNIKSKKVIVTKADWADYVFEPSYNLPSLDSVSSYIKANKHLPGMVNAATVEKQGLDVGEIVKQQQEKIEELMLYILQLKEEIKVIKESTK